MPLTFKPFDGVRRNPGYLTLFDFCFWIELGCGDREQEVVKGYSTQMGQSCRSRLAYHHQHAPVVFNTLSDPPGQRLLGDSAGRRTFAGLSRSVDVSKRSQPDRLYSRLGCTHNRVCKLVCSQ